VHIVSHAASSRPTRASFRERSGFLFVGPLLGEDAPNVEGVRWFATNVMPLLRQQLGADARVTIAGALPSSREWLSGDAIELLGQVADVYELMNRARVFVAPIRYGAGVPLKVVEAAAAGLPVVSSGTLARLLGWHHGDELLAADDPHAFAESCVQVYRDQELWVSLRSRALARVAIQFSDAQFRDGLAMALRTTVA
jgi:glycosyltransferase involved in cell wall biosynthesis